MSRLFTLFAIASFTVIGSWEPASAETRVVTTSSTSVQRTTYRCSKCGQLHYTKASTADTKVVQPAPSVVQASPNASTAVAVTPASATPAAGEVKTVSAEIINEVPMASSSRMRAGGGVTNVLAALNAQRARIGVRALRFDPTLQAVAQRRAQMMASRGLKGHPPGSFSPGRYEGVGWSGSYSPSKVSACFTSDSRMQYAGAAMATGRDGVYFAVVYR